ncbi:MAG: YceI family protein [Solirubrobacteraceae bacterium]
MSPRPTATDGAAQTTRTLRLVPERSRVRFRVRSGPGPLKVQGSLRDVRGELHCAGGEPVAVKGAARAASIDTGLRRRDRHLRSADFLAAEAHPDIAFDSTAITPLGDGAWLVLGELRLRGVEQTLTVVAAVDEQPDGDLHVRVNTRLDRRAFGVAASALDPVMVGRHIDVTLDLVATERPA